MSRMMSQDVSLFCNGLRNFVIFFTIKKHELKIYCYEKKIT